MTFFNRFKSLFLSIIFLSILLNTNCSAFPGFGKKEKEKESSEEESSSEKKKVFGRKKTKSTSKSKNAETAETDQAKTKTAETKTEKEEIKKTNTEEQAKEENKEPETETEPTEENQSEAQENNSEKKELEAENKELQKITKERKENNKKTIDAINFIQPSTSLSDEEQIRINESLSKAEQQQLTILWRATLERNKTIRFIVEKLAPENENKKKNQVLSQILNTAIFLPFYALQTVSPTDTSQLASYVAAGLTSDLINGKAKKNDDRIQLSQTEMVIMFMMIDQVAERVRNQFYDYKQERIDAYLANYEMKEAKEEASAALDMATPESLFLSQVRIRQIERELRRINLRVRSNRIVLVDLCGGEAVSEVDKLIDKEIAAIADLPPTS